MHRWVREDGFPSTLWELGLLRRTVSKNQRFGTSWVIPLCMVFYYEYGVWIVFYIHRISS